MNILFYNRDFTRQSPFVTDWQVNSLHWQDMGGCNEARLTATGDQNSLYTLTSMLRCPVEIYDPLGQAVWWGYVSEVQINSDAYSYGAQLDTMSNSVAVAYSFVAAGDNTVGVRKTTGYVTNANSIAEYGTKDALVSASGMTDAAAAQLGTTTLNTHAYPQGQITWGAYSPNTANVICKGWWQTLAWRMCTVAGTASVATDTQITSILSTYGQFITSSIVENTSGVSSNQGREGDATALDVVQALMTTGTTNGRRLLATVDIARRVILYEEPASTTVAYTIKRNGDVLQGGGSTLPYMVRPGNWARLADVPATADTTLLIDASTQFITGVGWDASQGLTPEFRGDATISTAGGGNVNLGELRPMIQNMVGGWTPYTPTFTGFTASVPSGVFRYTLIGKLCIVVVHINAAGTSNATGYTMTAPFTAATVASQGWYSVWSRGQDNGVNLTVPGRVNIASGASTITIEKDIAGAVWTNANGKYAEFTLIYETA